MENDSNLSIVEAKKAKQAWIQDQPEPSGEILFQ